MWQRPKVSVIIPVYGVEKFIGRCVQSLMKQTLEEIEYIFVDDASKDRSLEILRKTLDLFPERKEFVTILSHEKMQGYQLPGIPD